MYELVRGFVNGPVFGTLARKGRAYSKEASGGDALSVFKEGASALGISPLVYWAALFNKHHSALLSYVRGGYAGAPPFRVIKDMVCYLLLFYALLVDLKMVNEEDVKEDGDA